jgi:hypothetical protein
MRLLWLSAYKYVDGAHFRGCFITWRRILSMDVEAEIRRIKERNARVEADKAWETSFARRMALAIGTYVLSALFLLAINAQNAYLAALVPALGFLLSTLTLPFVKARWLRGHDR